MSGIGLVATEIRNHSTVITVGNYTVNGYLCSAMAAMTIVGNHAYCIKTYGKNDDEEARKFPIVFYEIKNFRSSTPTEKHWTIKTEAGNTSIAMHANSLTYANGVFYVATMNSVGNGSQVVGFSITGAENASEIRLSEKYTYTNKVTSINYYGTVNGNKQFLVCVGDNDDYSYYRFHKAYIAGNQFVQDNGITFITYFESEYNEGNDSHYDLTTKMLYTTRFIKPSSGMITTNVIYQYDLTAGVSGNNGSYNPVRIMQFSNNSDEAKFEIEGMAIHEDTRKKYACANISEQSGVEGVDTICFLY